MKVLETRMEKRSVPLREVVPSGANPRKDFGDIDRLAAAIEATGGQCVNPPVVVKDGNAYRVVDGERRLRALRKVWAGEKVAMVDVLVCDDYDAADEAVAMLATDDKKQLTEAERAAGTQTMLLLGVDDARVAGAAGSDVTTVRRARKVVRRVPEGYECSLEQLAAAEELGEGEDADAVMAAGVDGWKAVAAQVSRRREAEARMAELLSAFEAAGGQVVDEEPVDGYHTWRYVHRVPDLPESARGWLGVAWAGSGLHVFEPGEDARDAEAEERELVRAEHRRLLSFACADMCRFVAGGESLSLRKDTAAWVESHPALALAVVNGRAEVPDTFDWGWQPPADMERGAILASEPSAYEVACWVCRNLPSAGCSLIGWDLSPMEYVYSRFCKVWDACAEDGWEPDEGYAGLRRLADGDGEDE